MQVFLKVKLLYSRTISLPVCAAWKIVLQKWLEYLAIMLSLSLCMRMRACACLSSPAVEPVADVVNVGRLIAQVLRVAQDQHATDQRWPTQNHPQHTSRHLTAKSTSRF